MRGDRALGWEKPRRSSGGRPARDAPSRANGLTRLLPGAIALAMLLAAPLQQGFAQEQRSATLAPARDISSIQQEGLLRVAMTRFDLPAFHQRSPDGSVVGLEVDLARAIAQALGVKVALNADYNSFDTVAEAVAAGRADIGLSKLSQTYYRVQRVLFSQPYVTLRHAMLYDRLEIANMADGAAPSEVLRNFHGKIGVIAASAYVDFGRRNFPRAEIVPLENWELVIRALKERRVDAVYRDEFEIRRVLKHEPALSIKFGAALITDQKAFLSIAICDTCSKLQQFINYHLTEYPQTVTIDNLLELAGHN
jgi:ABC-type amino acid transport substrate-binding protein